MLLEVARLERRELRLGRDDPLLQVADDVVLHDRRRLHAEEVARARVLRDGRRERLGADPLRARAREVDVDLVEAVVDGLLLRLDAADVVLGLEREEPVLRGLELGLPARDGRLEVLHGLADDVLLVEQVLLLVGLRDGVDDVGREGLVRVLEVDLHEHRVRDGPHLDPTREDARQVRLLEGLLLLLRRHLVVFGVEPEEVLAPPEVELVQHHLGDRQALDDAVLRLEVGDLPAVVLRAPELHHVAHVVEDLRRVAVDDDLNARAVDRHLLLEPEPARADRERDDERDDELPAQEDLQIVLEHREERVLLGVLAG
ncbi:MAG: hypothetical protein H6745_17435 [Deltaproteobacteria bacterium]|nr:hypothetical protein [Deltaproteobacteria bacterium]